MAYIKSFFFRGVTMIQKNRKSSLMLHQQEDLDSLEEGIIFMEKQ